MVVTWRQGLLLLVVVLAQQSTVLLFTWSTLFDGAHRGTATEIYVHFIASIHHLL